MPGKVGFVYPIPFPDRDIVGRSVHAFPDRIAGKGVVIGVAVLYAPQNYGAKDFQAANNRVFSPVFDGPGFRAYLQQLRVSLYDFALLTDIALEGPDIIG